MTGPRETGGTDKQPETAGRRDILKRVGRFVAVSAPTVTLLMAARTKPAAALPSIPIESSRQFKTGEGALDPAAVLAVVTSGIGTGNIDLIDGVGMCLAAIKGLADKISSLEMRAATT